MILRFPYIIIFPVESRTMVNSEDVMKLQGVVIHINKSLEVETKNSQQLLANITAINGTVSSVNFLLFYFYSTCLLNIVLYIFQYKFSPITAVAYILTCCLITPVPG